MYIYRFLCTLLILIVVVCIAPLFMKKIIQRKERNKRKSIAEKAAKRREEAKRNNEFRQNNIREACEAFDSSDIAQLIVKQLLEILNEAYSYRFSFPQIGKPYSLSYLSISVNEEGVFLYYRSFLGEGNYEKIYWGKWVFHELGYDNLPSPSSVSYELQKFYDYLIYKIETAENHTWKYVYHSHLSYTSNRAPKIGSEHDSDDVVFNYESTYNDNRVIAVAYDISPEKTIEEYKPW